MREIVREIIRRLSRFGLIIGTLASIGFGEVAREISGEIFKHAVYGAIVENIESAVGFRMADIIALTISHVIPIGIAAIIIAIVWQVAHERGKTSILGEQIPSMPEGDEGSGVGGPSHMIPLIGMAFFGVGFIVRAAWYFSTRGGASAIAWSFEKGEAPFGYSRRAGGPLWIDGFEIRGHNNSDEVISSIEASVRSDITGHVIKLDFFVSPQGRVPTEGSSILPDRDFTLFSKLPSTDPAYSEGVSIDAFRTEFGRFTFLFDYDATKFTRHFGASEVEATLDRLDKETREGVKRRPLTMPDSGVVRDEDKKP